MSLAKKFLAFNMPNTSSMHSSGVPSSIPTTHTQLNLHSQNNQSFTQGNGQSLNTNQSLNSSNGIANNSSATHTIQNSQSLIPSLPHTSLHSQQSAPQSNTRSQNYTVPQTTQNVSHSTMMHSMNSHQTQQSYLPYSSQNSQAQHQSHSHHEQNDSHTYHSELSQPQRQISSYHSRIIQQGSNIPLNDSGIYQKYSAGQEYYGHDSEAQPTSQVNHPSILSNNLQSPTRQYQRDSIRERSETPNGSIQTIYRGAQHPSYNSHSITNQSSTQYPSRGTTINSHSSNQVIPTTTGTSSVNSHDSYVNNSLYNNAESYRPSYYSKDQKSEIASHQNNYFMLESSHQTPYSNNSQSYISNYSSQYPTSIHNMQHGSNITHSQHISNSHQVAHPSLDVQNNYYDNSQYYRTHSYPEGDTYYNGYSNEHYMNSRHNWKDSSQNGYWNRQQSYSPPPHHKSYSTLDQIQTSYDYPSSSYYHNQYVQYPNQYSYQHLDKHIEKQSSQEQYPNYQNNHSRSENVYQPPPPTSDTPLPPLPVSSQPFGQNQSHIVIPKTNNLPIIPFTTRSKSENLKKKYKTSRKSGDSSDKSESPEIDLKDDESKKDKISRKRKRNLKEEVDSDFDLKSIRGTKRQKALAKKKQLEQKQAVKPKKVIPKAGKRQAYLENFVEFEPIKAREDNEVVTTENFRFTNSTFDMFSDVCISYNDAYQWIKESFIDRCNEDAERRYEHETIVPSESEIKKIFRFLQWNLNKCLHERENQLKLQPKDRIRPVSWHLKTIQEDERKILETLKYGRGVDVLEMLYITDILKITEKDIEKDIAQPSLYRLENSSDEPLSNFEISSYTIQSDYPATKRIDPSSFELDPSEIETDFQIFGIGPRHTRGKKRFNKPPTLTPLRNGQFERIKTKKELSSGSQQDDDDNEKNENEEYIPEIDEDITQNEKKSHRQRMKHQDEADYTPTDSNDSMSNDDNYYNTRSRKKKADSVSDEDDASQE